MDLSTFGRDDEGQPTEYMPLEDTYSPTLHRVNQVIRWRAVHPNDEIPPVPGILIKYSNPPDELIQKAQRSLDAMLAAGGVKKVPPKALHSRKRGRDMPKPLSGLDVTELLGRERRTRISPDNAIPEFKQLLAAAEDVTTIKDATQQMAAIVQSLIRHSVGDSGYGRAVEAIRVMREELVDLEEPECFNAFLRELKRMLLAEELGGERREMWWLIR
ncbi:ATP-dependent DNA helicase yku80, partial [Cryomyces antarcticus]